MQHLNLLAIFSNRTLFAQHITVEKLHSGMDTQVAIRGEQQSHTTFAKTNVFRGSNLPKQANEALANSIHVIAAVKGITKYLFAQMEKLCKVLLWQFQATKRTLRFADGLVPREGVIIHMT